MLAATDLQTAKTIVRAFEDAMAGAMPDTVEAILEQHCAPEFRWRGMHPYHDQYGTTTVADTFWRPFLSAFASVQRRRDVFFAGRNDCDGEQTVWVCSMGNYMGLFDADWLGIPATRRLSFLRYAEFHRIEDGKIAETAAFCDILSVMHQAGVYPLPPATGSMFLYPGPRTHDGLLFDAGDPDEGERTLALINEMIGDLSAMNFSGNDRASYDMLRRTWHEDMIWYGPFGIGATYTIDRYQEQHTFPFRLALENKIFNGHVARLAEGSYGGFFGWPNLTNTSKGGFLGLPGSKQPADMRVVDVYRRDGDRLAENWVFIDLLHYLNQQGLDVLERNRQLRGLSQL